MPAQVLRGDAIAEAIRAGAAREAAELRSRGVLLRVAAVHNERDPAVRAYMKRQRAACADLGAAYDVHPIGELQFGQAKELVARLSSDPSVTAVTIHEPLPPGYVEGALEAMAPPAKDAEGTHPENLGRLAAGLDGPRPAAAQAAVEILRAAREDCRGLDAVVVGRSALVGTPAALLLLRMGPKAPTVTVCHTATRDLAAHTRRADILIVAAGRAGAVRGDMVKPGAIVIDVGINRLDDGRLVGDVAFDEVARVAGAITPVPGGVGPVAVAVFLRNLVTCARLGASNR